MEKKLKVLRLKKEKEGFVFSHKELEPKRGMSIGIAVINSNQVRMVSEEDIDTLENREKLKRELMGYNTAQMSKHEQEFLKKKEEIMKNIKEIEKIIRG